MAKKSKSMIGHDPLAWLKDDAEDADITEVEEKSVTKAKAKNKTAVTKAKAEKAQDTASESVFEIQAVQEISSVTEVHEQMKKLFKNNKVILNGENVERIDAVSLQLILSFIQEAKINDVEVSWNSPSIAISNSAKLLGMEDVLQLKKVV